MNRKFIKAWTKLVIEQSAFKKRKFIQVLFKQNNIFIVCDIF